MCGFAGYITENGKAPEYKDNLIEMMNSIKHRGPDDEGTHIDDMAGMGFRRLSIIGITNGKQPMYNEDESIVVTFNGEIYNYQTIKEELIKKGHIFKTDADTEVLVHGYEEYGKDLLQKLRGMYAFAIWDIKKKEMFMARDIFGIKPLFYTQTDKDFVFGSEIKAILKFPTVKKDLNEEALESYLSFQYSILKETFFKGIYRLPPAHCLTWKDGKVTVERYWEPVFDTDDNITFDEAVKMTNDVMKNSIEAHKISDTEVGGFLSGGVDSSYIVARSNLDKTFSVGFDYPKCNEIPLAKTLSDYVGVKNTSKLISTEEFFTEFPKIMNHVDEPLSDPSSIALYFLCKLASENVKVVLSGEGSDELFGGYNIYKSPFALAPMYKIPRPVRRGLAKTFQKLPFRFKGKNYVIRAGQDLEERYIGNAYIFKTKEVYKLLKNPKKKYTPQSITKPIYDKVKDKDDITKMQYIDINTWLWGDILNKADTMSMAHSLEVRVPFLDREVAKVAFSIPVKHRVDKHETKRYFRKAANEFMPDITAERKKLGFPIPVRNWLKEDKYYHLVKSTLTSKEAEKFFNVSELEKLLDDHYNGKVDNSRKVWTIYAFILWYQKHFVEAA
ncbi:asparagine synthase (glutamine-hydrolyzing) [Lachnospiraceae bacterium HCP1S3_C3]|nr:asparagine synthase (glutamine-hydrolyzing) [Lachnospiraceae bacterium]MDD6858155.1 asparagine synthase (glutamine-hydrolyzing) [Lachnospiraceae bacterium]